MLYIAISAFLVVLFFPDQALAWGPATHLELGETILKNAALIAPAARALITRYPYDFLYGNISADIVVGKNLVEELKHCHNWSVAFKVLDKAENDAQRSFAHGYLGHLAADTVAHNHFIPEMLIRSFTARTLRHVYWELRFDALAPKRMWKLPKKLTRNVDPGCDDLLDRIIEDTPLSFRTNKRIFSSMLSMQRVERWHHMLELLSTQSKWVLHKKDKERFFNAALEMMYGLFKDFESAPCLRKDPTGRHNLNSAKFLRKKLKNIRRQGSDWQPAMENALKLVTMEEPGRRVEKKQEAEGKG